MQLNSSCTRPPSRMRRHQHRSSPYQQRMAVLAAFTILLTTFSLVTIFSATTLAAELREHVHTESESFNYDLRPSEYSSRRSYSPTAPDAASNPYSADASRTSRCKDAAAFRPVSMAVPGVGSRIPVIAVRRDRSGTPGVAPVSTRGKRVFAWDAPGVHPGAVRGNVLMNAHAWPDGSALGNAILRKVWRGTTLRVRGSSDQVFCYRVYQRTSYKAENAPLSRVYNRRGAHQLVIITCSGRRLGPGRWSHRTVWFAGPIVSGRT